MCLLGWVCGWSRQEGREGKEQDGREGRGESTHCICRTGWRADGVYREWGMYGKQGFCYFCHRIIANYNRIRLNLLHVHIHKLLSVT